MCSRCVRLRACQSQLLEIGNRFAGQALRSDDLEGPWLTGNRDEGVPVDAEDGDRYLEDGTLRYSGREEDRDLLAGEGLVGLRKDGWMRFRLPVRPSQSTKLLKSVSSKRSWTSSSCATASLGRTPPRPSAIRIRHFDGLIASTPPTSPPVTPATRDYWHALTAEQDPQAGLRGCSGRRAPVFPGISGGLLDRAAARPGRSRPSLERRWPLRRPPASLRAHTRARRAPSARPGSC